MGFEEGKITSCIKSILNQDSDIEIIKSYEYDDVGRLETTRCNSVLHPQPGSIENIVAYDSQDKIIESFQNIIPDQIAIRNRWTYDHVGRQKKAFCQVTTPDLNQANGLMTWPEQELSELRYNAKELITDLNLGGNLQNVDYGYLPNRLLTNINSSNDDGAVVNGIDPITNSKDLFGMNIGYDNSVDGGFSNIQERTDGNISNIQWRYRRPNNTVESKKRYRYTYDFLKRLTGGGDQSSGANNHFSEIYNYEDLRGNIASLTRRSKGDLIDNLSYSYNNNTNQIKSIADASGSTQGFKAIGSEDYAYDENGAMTFDQGRNADYSYNHLNLPYQIAIPDSSGFVRYYYTGDGTLHRQEEIRDSTIYLIRDYIGGIEYVNGAIDQIIHDNGYIALDKGFDEDHLRLTGDEISDRTVPDLLNIEYISEQMIILSKGFEVSLGADFLADIDTCPVQGLDYRYFLKDHLGSVRVEFKDDGTGTAVPTNVTNYYPFGLPWDSDTDTRNNWTYTGQELQRSFDLGVMNYVARFYDPSIGRFMSTDPMTDYRAWVSPYNYVQNNPVIRVDPDGAFDVIVNPDNQDFVLETLHSRTSARYTFDENNLLIRDASVEQSSDAFSDGIDQAIGSDETLLLSQGDMIYDAEIGMDVSIDFKHGGGLTRTLVSGALNDNNEIEVKEITEIIITGEPMVGQDKNGEQLIFEAGDIMLHEWVGHALPNMGFPGTGNAIDNENKVRNSLGLKERKPEKDHHE